jgi:hypothetical protein
MMPQDTWQTSLLARLASAMMLQKNDTKGDEELIGISMSQGASSFLV